MLQHFVINYSYNNEFIYNLKRRPDEKQIQRYIYEDPYPHLSLNFFPNYQKVHRYKEMVQFSTILDLQVPKMSVLVIDLIY